METDKIEKEEMIRQQTLMAENGVGMPMIHSRFGREIEYLGTEWMELVKTSLAYSKKTAQKIWLYDEDNWLVPARNLLQREKNTGNIFCAIKK